MPEESLAPGERIKVVRAVSCSSEPFIGKTGTIVRKGGGFLESHFFVRMDGAETDRAFYWNELGRIVE
jgi:hypothetical protein